jgi:ABC-2 type transport system ATP-binding protein
MAIETERLGKRYGRRGALHDCTVAIPAGRVVGLVGANGAGKSTLLQLAAGLLEPTEGSLAVLGGRPGAGPAQLARVGFLAQDAPVYGNLTVGDHLELGARLNPGWDRELADGRIERLGLDRRQKAGRLSGGQRAQLALTLAVGKRPELLLLDEPVASLDPLARREFLGDLMELAADHGPTVVLSSHLLSDVERVCDHVVVLAGGRVRLAGDVDELLAEHKVLTGARGATNALPADQTVVRVSQTDRQSTLLIRTTGPILDPRWEVADVGLEELVLAYMSADASARPLASVGS